MLITDSKTWQKVKNTPSGYIYNDFGTKFPGDSSTWNTSEFNKLHKVGCRVIDKMTFSTEEKDTKHFFETRREAIDWLVTNRQKDGYSLCGICKP